MEFSISNYFHITNAQKWRCQLHNISSSGTVTLMVFPDPPARSRMHVEIRNTIYYDLYAGWTGCFLNVATSEELRKFIPKLGNHLRHLISEEEILLTYKLFVFQTRSRDYYLVAQDAHISQLFP